MNQRIDSARTDVAALSARVEAATAGERGLTPGPSSAVVSGQFTGLFAGLLQQRSVAMPPPVAAARAPLTGLAATPTSLGAGLAGTGLSTTALVNEVRARQSDERAAAARRADTLKPATAGRPGSAALAQTRDDSRSAQARADETHLIEQQAAERRSSQNRSVDSRNSERRLAQHQVEQRQAQAGSEAAQARQRSESGRHMNGAARSASAQGVAPADGETSSCDGPGIARPGAAANRQVKAGRTPTDEVDTAHTDSTCDGASTCARTVAASDERAGCRLAPDRPQAGQPMHRAGAAGTAVVGAKTGDPPGSPGAPGAGASTAPGSGQQAGGRRGEAVSTTVAPSLARATAVSTPGPDAAPDGCAAPGVAEGAGRLDTGRNEGRADAGDPASFASTLAQSQAPSADVVAPGTAPAIVLQASLATPVDDPGFGRAVMLRVSDLAGQGVQQATLELNPAEMGPIRIHLALHGADARIHFSAAHEHTRGLLEAALPALAAALQDDGLRLAQASVAGLADPADAAGRAPGAQGGAMGQGGGGAGRDADAKNRRAALADAATLGAPRVLRLAGQGWGEAAGSASGPRSSIAGSPGLDLYA
jgi:flagellar hook-length control protein FliK